MFFFTTQVKKNQGIAALSVMLALSAILVVSQIAWFTLLQTESSATRLAVSHIEAKIAAESGLHQALHQLRAQTHMLHRPLSSQQPIYQVQAQVLSENKLSLHATGWSTDRRAQFHQMLDLVWRPFLVEKINHEYVQLPLQKWPWLWPFPTIKMHACASGFVCVPDCQQLPKQAPYLLVQGDCYLRESLGSVTHPVLLWVLDGALDIGDHVTITGIIGMLTTENQKASIEFAPNARIIGALVTPAIRGNQDMSHLFFQSAVVASVQQFGQWFIERGSWRMP